MDVLLVAFKKFLRRRKAMWLASVICMSLLVLCNVTFRSTAAKDLADNISKRSLPLA
jgi:hypothetical protein